MAWWWFARRAPALKAVVGGTKSRHRVADKVRHLPRYFTHDLARSPGHRTLAHARRAFHTQAFEAILHEDEGEGVQQDSAAKQHRGPTMFI